MQEIERTLWNFLFAVRRCAAADDGRAPQKEATEIAERAVKDLSAALRQGDATRFDFYKSGPLRVTVEPLA